MISWSFYDELQGSPYGPAFFEKLEQYIKQGKLSEKQAGKIANTLIRADEIREEYAPLILRTLYAYLDAGKKVEPVLKAVVYCCEIASEPDEAVSVEQVFDLLLQQVEPKTDSGPAPLYEAIGVCPVCGGELKITRLSCVGCGTQLTGNFALSRFSRLQKEELLFAETFLRVQGNIKEMEKEFGISYPTVKKNLELILRKMGLNKKPDSREEILEKIRKREITVEQAIAQMKGM